MSKIDDEIWINSPNNTNTAEAAHALSNRRGKNLKIVTAILQYVLKCLICLFFLFENNVNVIIVKFFIN
jgi:hypothetical protein